MKKIIKIKNTMIKFIVLGGIDMLQKCGEISHFKIMFKKACYQSRK